MATSVAERPHTEESSGSSLLRPLLVAVATVVTIFVNSLASTLPLNGQDTGAISDSFSVFFVPAGYVFAIWGVIYIGLVAYTIYQLLPAQRDNALLKAIAPWYILSAVANTTWIFAWHYLQFGLSLGIMLVLLVSLIVIYRILAGQRPASRGAFWTVHLPFSIYLAWVCVATIANATSFLSLTSWNGFGIAPEVWGAIMVGVATLLGLVVSYVRADIGFVAVFVWALAGIAVKHSGTPAMLWSAAIGAGLLALSLIYTVPGRRRRLAASASAFTR